MSRESGWKALSARAAFTGVGASDCRVLCGFVVRALVASPALIWAAALAVGVLADAVEAVPVLTLARPQDQARFRVTTFASGLSFPTSMVQLDDGSLLVAESVGTSLFGSSGGRIVRLVDHDADGVADAPPQVVASSGIPGVLTSLVRSGSLIAALASKTGSERITFWRTSSDAAASLQAAGGVTLGFPAGFSHTAY